MIVNQLHIKLQLIAKKYFKKKGYKVILEENKHRIVWIMDELLNRLTVKL